MASTSPSAPPVPTSSDSPSSTPPLAPVTPSTTPSQPISTSTTPVPTTTLPTTTPPIITTSTSTTPSPITTTTSAPPVQTTTADRTTSTESPNPDTSTSNVEPLPTSSTTSQFSVTTTLSVASTSVGQTTAIATSQNGQIYTTTVAFTTTLLPGSVITAAPVQVRASSSNIGSIVGGVVGGIGGLVVLALLAFLCLRRRRKDIFDGDFDPARVTSVNNGGGTLPKIDLGEGGILGNQGGVEEDDGMGGRLGAGAGSGGIITPYSFVPPAPVGGSTGVGGPNPQMHQMSNVGVVADGVVAAAATAYGNEKRTMRHQRQSTSASFSSGSHYPATILSTAHGGYQPVSPEPYSAPSEGESSSLGGGGLYYGSQPMGSGPSPGHSILSSSSGARNAKEIEAMGGRGGIVVSNPDELVGGGQQGQYPAFQQAYLETGPGRHLSSSTSSNSTAVVSPTHSPTPSRAVVVHEDGGRVEVRSKNGDREAEVLLSSEIPPTYDSLPVDVRRDA